MASTEDKSIQTEKEKLQLLDNRFYGVMNKLREAVAAKRKGKRLEAKNPWKVCFQDAKEFCPFAGKFFCGGGGSAI